MKVTLGLFASLRDGRFDSREFELAEGGTIGDLATLAGLPRADIAIVFVDGRHGDFDTVPPARARIAFFPPVGGG